MRRIDVATGVIVLDDEAGIGRERYVQQSVHSGQTPIEDATFTIDSDSEAAHRSWVENKGWRPAAADVGAAATRFAAGVQAVRGMVAELPR